jgi:regulator of replication initiation timing
VHTIDWSPSPEQVAFSRAQEAYTANLQLILKNSRNVGDFANLLQPRSETELSQRIDALLSRVWPEYRSDTLELDLLRRQSNYYERTNEKKRRGVDWTRSRLTEVGEQVRSLEAQVSSSQSSLVEMEAVYWRLSPIENSLINDTFSEQKAVASLLIFARNPRVTRVQLDNYAGQYWLPVRGYREYATAAVAPAAYAPMSAAEYVLPTSYGELLTKQPPASAPLGDKLGIMQTVGRGLAENRSELPRMRERLTSQIDEEHSLRVEDDRLNRALEGLNAKKAQLDTQLGELRDKLSTREEYLQASARNIMTELVIDMSLDRASTLLRDTAIDIAVAQGKSPKIPATGTKAFFAMARRGGKLVSLSRGYERYWSAFLSVQNQTLRILDRNEGFMLDASRLIATGSPDEIDAHIDRVFGSLNWQQAKYARTVGMSAVPDSLQKHLIEDALDRFLTHLKIRDQGKGDRSER